MSRSNAFVSTLLVACFAALAGCGVEVGNPNGGKPKTGTAEIYFAKTTSASGEKFSLAIASVRLTNKDAESSAAELSPSVSSFDLYSSEDDDVLVARSEEIAVGTYAKVTVTLAKNRVQYRNEDGAEGEAPFADEASQAIEVDEEVEISEGTSTPVVVSLDPRRSLAPADGAPDRRVFKPVGAAHDRSKLGQHSGSTDEEGAVWVCAYLYAPDRRPPPPPPPGLLGLYAAEPPPAPPPGVAIQRRPVFQDAASVIKDSSSACEHAFDRAPVREGRYLFRHLPPATYDFRAFLQDGSFVDLPGGVRLEPPLPPPPPPLRGMEGTSRSG